MLLLPRANPAAAIPVPGFSLAAYSWSLPTASSTAARCSAKLSAVQFQEPFRSDSHPWGAGDGVATTDDADQQHDDAKEYFNKEGPQRDCKGISGIHVPRQRYIAVSKAALLDAVLSLFSSEAAAADFKRFARRLDAVLYAEHKPMLEEMRTYYMLTQQQHQEEEEEESGTSSPSADDGQAMVNGKSSGFFGITQPEACV